MASQISASPECVGVVLDHVAFESLLFCKMLFNTTTKWDKAAPCFYLHKEKHFLLRIADPTCRWAEWVGTRAKDEIQFQQQPLQQQDQQES